MTDEPIAKVCIRCKEAKPETAFHRDGARGRSSTCAACRAHKRRINGREKNSRTSEQDLRERLWRFYRITLEQFAELRDAQGGVCAICGKPPADGKRLAVDHCHRTGVVRALLCTACNVAVGIYETHHRAVAEYLATYGNGNPVVKNAEPARGCTPPSRRKTPKPSQ